jgi:hypothetical protein
MRTSLALTVFIALVALGCSQSNNPVEQYGGMLTTSYSQGKVAGQVADLNAVKVTIASYYASNERYPASLEEVSALMRVPLPPDRYDYNPATGIISLK